MKLRRSLIAQAFAKTNDFHIIKSALLSDNILQQQPNFF